MSDVISPTLMLLHPDDNVVVCRRAVPAGTPLLLDGRPAVSDIDAGLGHKLARRAIGPGERILKYGAPIGSATAPIEPGALVHLHNMASDYIASHTRTLDGRTT